jgi:hypothetical protein
MELNDFVMEDFARQFDYWVAAGTEVLSDPNADVGWSSVPDSYREISTAISKAGVQPHVDAAVRELMFGLLHSIFVSIDGGTALADRLRLSLIDHDGQEVAPSLHEAFAEHLAKSGRI